MLLPLNLGLELPHFAYPDFDNNSKLVQGNKAPNLELSQQLVAHQWVGQQHRSFKFLLEKVYRMSHGCLSDLPKHQILSSGHLHLLLQTVSFDLWLFLTSPISDKIFPKRHSLPGHPSVILYLIIIF